MSKLWRSRGGALGALGAAGLAAGAVLAGDHWPQFRGPDGNGHTDARGLPLRWSEDQHVKWKTAIHGRAWASPVIWGQQVWLASATEDGTELFAICVHRDTGQVLWDLKLFDVERPQFAHKFNTYASPTPALEAGRLYLTFGSPGTACVDTQTGKVLWERRDFVCNHYRGAGSSPIVDEDLLLLHFDGSDLQYVVALDKRTGQTVWKQDRSVDYQDLGPDGKPMTEGDLRKAFATPHVALLDGERVLLSSGAKAHYALEPRTGKELWRVEERTAHSASTRPVVGHGLVFIPTGFSRGTLLAIRPAAAKESHAVVDAHQGPDKANPDTRLGVVWKSTRNVPCKPSLLLVEDLLFMVDDGGIASCLEAKTGAEVWRERVGGNYSASPLYGEGRVYLFSEEGKTTVLEAGRQFKVLATNQLGDGFMASPAVAGKALFLRSRTHLYRIEE